MKRMLSLVSVIIFSSVFLAACGGPSVKVGSAVWAEWAPDSWYHGTVDAECDEGWNVIFDDETNGCYPPSQVAADVAPSSVSVGDIVLAEWTEGLYLSATVKTIEGEDYNVEYYDDFSDTLSLSQLRLKPEVK